MSVKGVWFDMKEGEVGRLINSYFLRLIRAINKGGIGRYKIAISCDYLGRLIRATIRGLFLAIIKGGFLFACLPVSQYLIFNYF